MLTAWHGPGDIGPALHAANVHLDCSIPNFRVQEMVFFPRSIVHDRQRAPQFQNGYLIPSEQPGLGVDLNEQAAAKCLQASLPPHRPPRRQLRA